MQLFLIRHPAPEVGTGICYGQTDLALREAATAVAERIRPLLPAHLPVVTSPLRRCRELADILHPAPRIDERLREMHFGEWEMRPWQQIQRTALNGWAADPLGYAPPGGESVGELRTRVLACVAELQATGWPGAILVTHAGVMKVLVGHEQGLPARKWMALAFEYGSIVEARIDPAAGIAGD